MVGFSATKEGKFYVVKSDGSCTCPDFQFRGIQTSMQFDVDIRYSVVRTVKGDSLMGLIKFVFSMVLLHIPVSYDHECHEVYGCTGKSGNRTGRI